MSGIYDYVKWRGDIPIKDGYINYADSIVLCQLSYIDMTQSLSKDRSRSLREIVSELDKENQLNAMITGSTGSNKEYTDFFRTAAESIRFGNISVADYEETFDIAKTQFCAMRFILNDNHSYLAFRGTDDSIIGWREDFMISYRKTYAQKRAAEYINEVMKDGQEYFVGGHSKGGNLAMLAAASLSEKRLSQVEQVFVNDGPGICPDVVDGHILDRIQKITTEIIPRYCVVGKLFAPQFTNHYIIDSDEKGIMQHSMLSWQFEYGIPSWVQENDPKSIWLCDVMDAWMKNASVGERDKFVTDVFDSFEDDGARTFTDITANGFSSFENIIIKMLQAENVTKKIAISFPVTAIWGKESYLFGKFLNKMNEGKKAFAKILIQTIVGIIFLLIPNSGLESMIGIILALPVLYEIILTGYRLFNAHWNIQQERTRISICIILISAYLLILFKPGALFIIGSAVFGIMFLMESVQSIGTIRTDTLVGGEKAMAVIEGMMFMLIGGYILVAPDRGLQWYVFSSGQILTLDGIYRMIRLLAKHKK